LQSQWLDEDIVLLCEELSRLSLSAPSLLDKDGDVRMGEPTAMDNPVENDVEMTDA